MSHTCFGNAINAQVVRQSAYRTREHEIRLGGAISKGLVREDYFSVKPSIGL